MTQSYGDVWYALENSEVTQIEVDVEVLGFSEIRREHPGTGEKSTASGERCVKKRIPQGKHERRTEGESL